MARVGRITRISAAVLLAFLAACSDDGPDADADAEVIESALLTLDDVPDGFSETEVEDDPEATANSICNDEVLGLTEDEVDGAKSAETGPVQFGNAEVSVHAEITAFEDDEVPRRIIAGVADDEYLDCLADAVADLLPDNVTLGDVEALDPAVEADDAGAIAVQFVSRGTPVESQVHAARVGRFGISLEVTALEGEVDDDLVAGALSLMVERLRDA